MVKRDRSLAAHALDRGLGGGLGPPTSISAPAPPPAPRPSLSAGPLAFGPDGVLFVGDSIGGAVWAIDTGDLAPGGDGPIELQGLDAKLAELSGTTPDRIRINDLAVNPLSRRAYLSVSRGQGEEAKPAIFTLAPGGALELFALDRRHARAALVDAPDPTPPVGAVRASASTSITDLAFVDGNVFVAGLSNEEFSSKLRVLDFPFGGEARRRRASRSSTAPTAGSRPTSPVRTFATYRRSSSEPHLLAAYTCTPLVKIPVAELKPGAKVKGTTIAELGNRNRPLDMIVYTQGRQGLLLMANSSRGVMKVDLTAVATDRSDRQPDPRHRGPGVRDHRRPPGRRASRSPR